MTLHKTRTHSTHALIFGAPPWIAVVTGNIHMKTSQEQKIRREPFIRAVLVLDKTRSYKWYCCVLCKTQLVFLRINGPNVYIYIYRFSSSHDTLFQYQSFFLENLFHT